MVFVSVLLAVHILTCLSAKTAMSYDGDYDINDYYGMGDTDNEDDYRDYRHYKRYMHKDNHKNLDCTPKKRVFASDRSYFTQEICDGLYFYCNNAYSGMFLVTKTGVIMVDAPPSFSNLLAVVKSVTNKCITHVIYSHQHLDHIGAAKQYPKNAKYICHRKTQRMIQRVLKTSGIHDCTHTFGNKGYNLRVGGQVLKLRHAGYKWHTDNDVFIYAPRQKTMMVVDLVYPGWLPFKDLGLATDLQNYRKAHDFLLTFAFTNLVGGHVDRIGNRKDIMVQIQYIEDLKQAVAIALQNVPTFAQVAKELGFTGSNTFTILNEYETRIAKECKRIMIEEKNYASILTDATSYMQDNCWRIQSSAKINS